MKLTLWQQFSSNHSGSYRIVGMFGSTAEAEKAALSKDCPIIAQI